MYHWVGKLMGAAYRTDESLPISMPPFIWKVLVGEHVTWTRDFRGVDEAAVKMIGRFFLVILHYNVQSCFAVLIESH